MHAQQDLTLLIEYLDIGLDPAGVHLRHPGVAVVGVSGGAVGPQPLDSNRQSQRIRAEIADPVTGAHRLEAGIQQCRVDAVRACLRTDLTGQGDLRQHGPVGIPAGVHGTEAGERRAVLDTAQIQCSSHLGAVHDIRMCGK